MLRFLPIMFASGRVSFNRILVTLVDFLVIYTFLLAYDGVLHWSIGVFFMYLTVVFYTCIGYFRYFAIIKKHPLIKANFQLDDGIIKVTLTVKLNTDSSESFFIEALVKQVTGKSYPSYALFIGMSLCNSLILYARLLKSKGVTQ